MFNKLEIDVLQANELEEASQLSAKYKLPAMVVHPDLSENAFILRAKLGGLYKLITPVDWPKGQVFGMGKMRGLSIHSLDVDGFEILLTSGKTVAETRNEARSITDFIKRHLSDIHEVRFVLGTQINNEDNIKAMCEGLKGVRTPTYIRNDIHTKSQVNKANSDIHNLTIETLSSIVRAPYKIAGNIGTLRIITSCHRADRFGVNLHQMKAIVKELQQQKSKTPEPV